MYIPVSDSESEDIRKHIVTDGLILLQYIIFSSIIGKQSVMLGVVWATYIGSWILKFAFYLVFHPWATVLVYDLKSCHYPRKEPTITINTKPRKSFFMAVWDRINEGLLFEWSICTKQSIDQQNTGN